jgi:hypothetical protein
MGKSKLEQLIQSFGLVIQTMTCVRSSKNLDKVAFVVVTECGKVFTIENNLEQAVAILETFAPIQTRYAAFVYFNKGVKKPGHYFVAFISNMVSAYAKFKGLDTSPVGGPYLDQDDHCLLSKFIWQKV